MTKDESQPQAKPDLARQNATNVNSMAIKAKLRPRHYGLFLSLVLLVAAPVIIVALYLMVLAKPQYASEVGFVIRQEETGSGSQMLGGLTQILGTQSAGNSDLLFEFIQSQDIVQRIDDDFDLVAHYSHAWPWDPVFSVWPSATIEELVGFWKRMVRITYDQSSGIIMVEVRARSPDSAQEIASKIVQQSETMINTLNEKARKDSLANANLDLDKALSQLRFAREELIEYQARTQIIDPQADLQGRMGVMSNFQQQLAQALVDLDLLGDTASASDPRVQQLENRIEAIKDLIAEERQNFAAQNVTVENTDYPRLLAQYEGLRVDVMFAEENYRSALAAHTLARTNAERQQLYLATFIKPTLAQKSEYPQRFLLVSLTAFFAVLLWSALALVYYSLRDRG
ncbi:sugar transporter [Sulfitobacter sp. R18_2]|uniref:sugar transporter n=1 Tax=Sulfitobacter sp. R18_2 TaxID=2821105 RepID=UPI001ADD2225|nr:sugar transporter [Sulfitobacter sp. R18_2]MBO9440139.1 sugar transporter [Sulfitobacter sp. R18_2]